MKTKLILILLLITATITYGQGQLDVGKNLIFRQELNNQLIDDGTGKNIDLKKVKGSPYEVEKFIPGTASSKTIDNDQRAFFRYNIYNDVIEMKESLNDEAILGLINSLNIYATINNKEYHFEIYSNESNNDTDEGYFILISDEKNVDLYLKKIKIFEDAKEGDGIRKDIPAEFKDLDKYYYKTKEERILLPVSNNKKRFLANFSDKGDQLKKFMKDEKINLKNEKDLISIFKYYDSLIK